MRGCKSYMSYHMFAGCDLSDIALLGYFRFSDILWLEQWSQPCGVIFEAVVSPPFKYWTTDDRCDAVFAAGGGGRGKRKVWY